MNLRLLDKKGPRFQQLDNHDYIIFNYKRYKLQRVIQVNYSCYEKCALFNTKKCPGEMEKTFFPCFKIRPDGIKGYFTKAIQ